MAAPRFEARMAERLVSFETDGAIGIVTLRRP
ncbi:MAG: enoyl-CoA hydratase/isomerase family protein, partial [Mesorhizobium sp.]